MTNATRAATEQALATDWAGLKSFDHEYEAPRMASYFRALASDDEEEALRGYRELNDECLWMPNAFCPSGAAAFPLLLRMGIDGEVPHRDLPLRLAANVLAGGYLRHDHVGLDFGDPVVKRRYGRSHARIVYRHALEHYDAIAALLDDPDDNVKAHGALLLAFLWHQRRASAERLVARVQAASDKEARGAMLTALGLLLRYDRDPDATVATLRPLEAQADTPFERAVAHAARYLTPNVPFAPEAADVLAPLVLAGDGANAPYMWYDGYFPDAALAGLLLQGDEGVRGGQRMLLKLLREGPPEAQSDALYEYVRLSFGDRRKIATKEGQSIDTQGWLHRLEGMFGPDDLDASERQALEAIADLPLDSQHFERFGLPGRAADRRRLLGLDAAGVLETPVELEGRPMLLWQALRHLVRGECDIDVRDEPFLQLHFGDEPAKLAEIEAERCLGTYGLVGGSERALHAAFGRAGAAMASYARRVLDEHLRGARRVPDVYLANLLLRAVLLAEGELPIAYQALVTVHSSLVPLAEVNRGGDAGRRTSPLLVAVEIFAALPPTRRLALLRASLQGAPLNCRKTYDVHAAGYYLRHCPDPSIVATMLELLESERVLAELHRGALWRAREALPKDGILPVDIDEANLRGDLAAQLEPVVASHAEVAAVVALYEARRGKPLREV